MILFNEKFKKKFFLILLLFPTLINSQIIGSRKLNEINLLFLKVDFSAKYTKAEITYRNGTKEIGYIYGFIQNKALSFNFKNAFSSNPIDALNLSDKSFSFKKELDQKEIDLTSDEIIEVKIIEDGVNFGYYKLMDLATVNSDGTIKDLKKKAWLPFYSQDIINVFSYDIYEETEGANGNPSGHFEKIATMIYLNNPKDNLAINVMDYNFADIFSKTKLLNKWSGGLIEIFKNCPEFIKQNVDENNIWNFDSNYFDIEELEKTKKKEIKNDKTIKNYEKNILLNNLDSEIQITPYLRMIADYKKICH
jgi:hypothetical protein